MSSNKPVPQKKVVLLTRHAKTWANQEGIYDNDLNSRLIDEGIEQRDRLTERLATEGVDGIISSKALRSIETVAPLARRLKIKLETTELLLERGIASIENGIPRSDPTLKSHLKKQQVWDFLGLPHLDAETLHYLNDRALKSLKLFEVHPGKKLVACGHFNLMLAVCCTVQTGVVTGPAFHDAARAFRIPNTGIITLLYQQGHETEQWFWQIKVGDDVHLNPHLSFTPNLSP